MFPKTPKKKVCFDYTSREIELFSHGGDLSTAREILVAGGRSYVIPLHPLSGNTEKASANYQIGK